MTAAAPYVLLPNTLRANLTLCRRVRNHEHIELAEPVTVSGRYRLAEPTSDGCTWAEIDWLDGQPQITALHKVLRPLTESEYNRVEGLFDAERSAYVTQLVGAHQQQERTKHHRQWQRTQQDKWARRRDRARNSDKSTN